MKAYILPSGITIEPFGDSVRDTLIANRTLIDQQKEFLGNKGMTCEEAAGIEGIAGRMAYSSESDRFCMIWDEAVTTEMPKKLAQAVANTSTPTWPHTFVVPKYASMAEYKQYAPANHFHMTWDLKPARLQHWMDMTGVLSATPWAARPAWVEGVDRPKPLLHVINGEI